MGVNYRFRSPENIFEELKYFYFKRNINYFNFIDDNLLVKKDRIIKLCELILKNNLKLKLRTTGIYAKYVDYDTLNIMKKAGFYYFLFGVESANNHILKNIHKGETIEDIQKAIKIAKDLDYNIGSGFMIGQIGETEEDCRRSFKFALENNIDYVDFYNIIPYPGTELYEICIKNKYLLYPMEKYLNEITTRVNKPIFETPELSKKQRKKLFKEGFKIHKLIYKNNLRKIYLPKLNKIFFKDNFVNNIFKKFILLFVLNEFINRKIRPRIQTIEKILLKFLKK